MSPWELDQSERTNMNCGNCGARNSHKARRCRKCKANPRKAGNGLGNHFETSPMIRATRTKNRSNAVNRLACRKNKGKLSNGGGIYESL